MLEVTSEIYQEYDYITKAKPIDEKNVISEFPFILPKFVKKDQVDKDNDLDIIRPTKEIIKIEHREDTNIALVGLQVWRGAFLLGDLLIHLGLKGELRGKTILEVGAGTGITSFVAAMYAKKVICTDIDIGGILSLIDLNAKYNSKFIESEFKIMPLDFKDTNWNDELQKAVEETDIILAADVIYDNEVTSSFLTSLQKLLKTNTTKAIYIAIEKRFIFTIEHLDTVAPCFDHFMLLLDKIKNHQDSVTWEVIDVPLDFPKLFRYNRVKEMTSTRTEKISYALSNQHLVPVVPVIYDDDLTAAFVNTTEKLLNTNPQKTIYIALERRYVFHSAPCYDTFLEQLDKIKNNQSATKWELINVPLDFPRFFHYYRAEELVLWKITSNKRQ